MKFKALVVCTVLTLTLSACRKKSAATATHESTEPPPPSKGLTIPPGPAGTQATAEPGSPEHANLELLTFGVQQFYAMNKRMPADLQELAAAKLIPKVPLAPAGMKFVIEPQMKQVRLVKR